MKLKLFIDKNTNKVLYAEAGKDFVDLLLHIFMKPLGVAMKEHFDGSISGGLANLYTSVADDLSVDYLQSGSKTKAGFGNPNLLRTFYTCILCKTAIPNYVTDDSRSVCPCCGSDLGHKPQYFSGPCNSFEIGEGYVKGQVMYIVTDDLVVKPLSTSLTMKLLSELRIKDIAIVQESEVTLDSAKVMELVKASLTSKTVLTDILLPLNQAK